jgi:intracellular septation protein
MKLLLDFLPLILFFGTFKYADSNAAWAAQFASEKFGFLVSGGLVEATEAPVLLATLVVIVATVVQIGVTLLRGKKVDTMLWITFVLVVVLGGATVWFHNPTFIKWKPSVLYWAMGIGLWLSQVVFGKNMLKSMVGEQLELPARHWSRLNLAWSVFFIAMGCLNLWVAYHFSTSTWATFKVFGITGLMLVFMLVQGYFLVRHIEPDRDAVAAGPIAPVDLPTDKA